MIDTRHGWNVSIKPIVLGFIFSLVAIIATYRIATHHTSSNFVLVSEISIFASLQVILQLVFFLHIGLEQKPPWSLLMLLLMIFLMFIMVSGSIWIMHHLDYNMMPMPQT